MWLPVLALDDWLDAVIHVLGTELPTPLAPVRLLYSADLVDQLLLASHRVLPKVLLESGFEFGHPQLTDALDSALA